MKFQRGFTLIELLVVVAIISLLSSVILASLREARDNARYAKFDSEFLQLRTAIELYKADNNGAYPRSVRQFRHVTAVVSELYGFGYYSTGSINLPTDYVMNDFVYGANPNISSTAPSGYQNVVTCGSSSVSSGNYSLYFYHADRVIGTSKLPPMYIDGSWAGNGWYCIEI